MKSKKTSVAIRLAVAGLMAVTYLAPAVVLADEPATKPAEKTTRNTQAIIKDYQNKMVEVARLSGGKLTDPADREKAAPKLIPAIKDQIALVGELAAAKVIPATSAATMTMQPKAMLYLLGDADTKSQVDADAAGTDDKAMAAKSTQFTAQWIGSSDKAKVADDIEAFDKQHLDSKDLTQMTFALGMQSPDKALSDRLVKLATETMDNPTAKSLKKQATMMAEMQKKQAEAEKKMKGMEGKDFILAAKTVDGKDFTTADWKGKVVMVDFWATWCGPCVAGLPEVKEMYAKYHGQGFEIVGVSNDYKADALTTFIAKNEMPWPQLWNEEDGKANKWNRTTTGYGINGIPRLFLIDKKGVLRTIEARSNMKDMIPKLLAE